MESSLRAIGQSELRALLESYDLEDSQQTVVQPRTGSRARAGMVLALACPRMGEWGNRGKLHLIFNLEQKSY